MLRGGSGSRDDVTSRRWRPRGRIAGARRHRRDVIHKSRPSLRPLGPRREAAITHRSTHRSNEVNIRMQEAEVTSVEVNKTSEEYRPVAKRASLLYFCLADMANVDPMYQCDLRVLRR